MNLKHRMSELRHVIDCFIYHKRLELVIKVLWQLMREKADHSGPRERRLMLIKWIDECCEKEVPTLQIDLERERLLDQIGSMVTYQPQGRL